MVKVEDYKFTGPDGTVSLGDLFQGRRQLIVYHFMFDPAWDGPCRSCSFCTDQMPKFPEHLNSRDTTLVFVSRAPFDKLAATQEKMGWDRDWMKWYSSNGSSFNYDFNVTVDEAVKPAEYNFTSKATFMEKGMPQHTSGEQHGFSVFLKDGDDIYHTYSCYGRGPDHLLTTYGLLDLTPLGRQDVKGRPGLGFLYHDEY